MTSSTKHVPILLKEIVEALIPAFAREPGTYIDFTLGGGGHLAAMAEALQTLPHGDRCRLVGVDRDEAAIARVSSRLAPLVESGRLVLVHSSFARFELPPGLPPVKATLADLGFSSDQIDAPERGLSFRLEGPLDMRLDRSQGETALELLERVDERELADLIFEYGEERLSRKIARRIIEARMRGQIPDTTTGFADLVARVFPPAQRFGRIHPATRTFQALRIAVNDELGELDALLERVLPSVVTPGARCAFLSFHSLEDRRVKRAFQAKESHWKAVFRKPVEAGDDEVRDNPRSRSAKLRVAEWMDGKDVTQ